MVDWVAVGFEVLGALTMVVAVVLANVVLFRYLLARRVSIHDSVSRRAADIALATSLLSCAALTFIGASVLVLGLVVGNGTATWSLVIPLSPLVVIAAALVYAKQLSQRT
jgi:hypothetical protein